MFKKNKTGGHANCWNHVKSRHKDDYESILKNALESKKVTGSIDKHVIKTVSQGAIDVFKWIEWVIMSDMPVSFITLIPGPVQR